MSEANCIHSAIERGDSNAAEQVLPLVYDELRGLAARKLACESYAIFFRVHEPVAAEPKPAD
jgi:hypothetical protein